MSPVSDDDRKVLREAWQGFTKAMNDNGLDIIDGLDDVDNPQELAEALRCVARMAIMTLQQRMEFNDPDFPCFFRISDDRFKYAGPDTYVTYLSAAVRGTGTYGIAGNSH